MWTFWVITWCLNFMCRHFGTLCPFHHHGSLVRWTECSETSVHKIQMPGIHPKERIQHSQHGKSFCVLISWCVISLCSLRGQFIMKSIVSFEFLESLNSKVRFQSAKYEVQFILFLPSMSWKMQHKNDFRHWFWHTHTHTRGWDMCYLGVC